MPETYFPTSLLSDKSAFCQNVLLLKSATHNRGNVDLGAHLLDAHLLETMLMPPPPVTYKVDKRFCSQMGVSELHVLKQNAESQPP